MILEMILTALGVFALMSAWVLFQQFVKRHTPGTEDTSDPLSSQFGCSTCELSGSCGMATGESYPPPNSIPEIRLYD